MSFTKVLWMILAVLIGTGPLVGCGHSRGSSALDQRAAAVWDKHEAVFKKALGGYQKDDEFIRACVFFEKVTGLHMHVNYSTVGALPTQETDQDLQRLQSWYKINKERLYWNDVEQEVKVRPQ
jgi:hypothetical protein